MIEGYNLTTGKAVSFLDQVSRTEYFDDWWQLEEESHWLDDSTFRLVLGKIKVAGEIPKEKKVVDLIF